MFATAMAEYNHQKAELSQLFQDKQTIIEQIKNRTKTIYDMLEKIKIMEQEMELINAF